MSKVSEYYEERKSRSWEEISPRSEAPEDPIEVLKALEQAEEVEEDPFFDNWSIPDEEESRREPSSAAEEETELEEEHRQDIWRYWLAIEYMVDCIGQYASISKLIVRAEQGSARSRGFLAKMCSNPDQEKEYRRLAVWDSFHRVNTVALRLGLRPTGEDEFKRMVRYLSGHVDSDENPDHSQARRDWIRRQSKLKDKDEVLSLSELCAARRELDAKASARRRK